MSRQGLRQPYYGLVRFIHRGSFNQLHPGVETRLRGLAGLAGHVPDILSGGLLLLSLEPFGDGFSNRLGPFEAEILQVVVSLLLLAERLQGFPWQVGPGSLVATPFNFLSLALVLPANQGAVPGKHFRPCLIFARGAPRYSA
jgi:hypothetical protein